jgi:hypothetical protein
MTNFTQIQSDFPYASSFSSVIRLFANNIPIIPISFSVSNLTPIFGSQTTITFYESFDNEKYVISYVNNTRVRFLNGQSGITFSLPYTAPCPPFIKLNRQYSESVNVLPQLATFSTSSTTIYFDAPVTLSANDYLTYDYYGTPQAVGNVLSSVVNATSVQLRFAPTSSATNAIVYQTTYLPSSPITLQCVSVDAS